jgi:hypothetical protein
MRPSGEVNAQGRMTYHGFPVLNNQIQAPLVREDGQIIRIDLQTAWEGERKSASATRLQELNQMREDYFKPTPTVNPGFVR